MYARGVRGQAGMAAVVALNKKWYLYRWQMLTNSPTKWSKLNCQIEWFVNIAFAVLFLLCTVLHADLYLFSVRQMSKCFIQIGVQKVNPTTINAFTEAQKFISTSKGFSSRLEKNFPALILLFPLSRIWKITQNTGKVSYNFKYLSAQWQRRTLSAKCISSLWW